MLVMELAYQMMIVIKLHNRLLGLVVRYIYQAKDNGQHVHAH